MSIPSPLAIKLSASYGWDTEGKLSSMTYPTYGGSTALVFNYQYDSIGRLNGMTEDRGFGQGQQSMATATLGPAGALNSRGHGHLHLECEVAFDRPPRAWLSSRFSIPHTRDQWLFIFPDGARRLITADELPLVTSGQ